MDTIRLTHLFTHFTKLGGVESILKNHLSQDHRWGIEPRVLAFFETRGEINAQAIGLGLTWRDSIVSSRSKFRRASMPPGPDVAFYHNFWGVPFLADLDQARRRMALLHSDWPGIERGLRAQRGLVDGVICVNEVLKSQVQQAMPALPTERIFVVPLPIDSPKSVQPHPPLKNRPIVFGFCGRVIREQKRVDRMPQLCRKLDDAGIDYRFEILGDGPALAWLQDQLASNHRVHFHGRQTGPEYWKILQQWDAILFMSDYEGLPISLLEAYSCGVLAIYPRIRSGGDSYVDSVHPDLLYAPEDFGAVLRILSKLQTMPDQEISSLRRTCQLLSAPHEGNAYNRAYAEFVRHIHESPRITPEKTPSRRAYWSDLLPFGLMRRVYYKGFYRRNDGW
jgi:glycosyltransferase involved in cell wall biosynthesis